MWCGGAYPAPAFVPLCKREHSRAPKPNHLSMCGGNLKQHGALKLALARMDARMDATDMPGRWKPSECNWRKALHSRTVQIMNKTKRSAACANENSCNRKKEKKKKQKRNVYGYCTATKPPVVGGCVLFCLCFVWLGLCRPLRLHTKPPGWVAVFCLCFVFLV